MTSMATILRLIPTLNDQDLQTLRDVLRPAPAPRKKVAIKREKKKPLLPTEPELMICSTCGNPSDFVDHQRPSPNYHPFVVEGIAPRAAKKSSAKGAVKDSTVNTETPKDAALAATGGE